MKKSKIIVPALGILLLSAAASVSGTVAWFTANRTFEMDAGNFSVISGQDGSFTPEQFVERSNTDLANSLGNLLNRTVSMINKYFQGVIPSYQGKVTPFDGELESVINVSVKQYENLLDDLKITEAITCAMDIVGRANKYIDETMPWALAKDETKQKELASVMNHLTRDLTTCGAKIALYT